MKYKSNQYKRRKQPIMPAWMVAEFYFSIVAAVFICGVFAKVNHKQFISPVAQAHAQTVGSHHPAKETITVVKSEPTVTPTPTVTPERQQIDEYINEVFGTDADKFNKLLDCENHARNPQAKNFNYEDGSAVITSTDWGIAQINDRWQGVTNPAFLTDYKINIMMAHNIYARDGHSFKLWTCGRKLGL